MAGFRAYFKNNKKLSRAEQIILSADESRHLCGSLRAKIDDEVRIFDLESNCYDAKILDANPKATKLEILNAVILPEKKCEIHLLMCMPANSVFDDILRQAAEIGISGIHPILSENSQIKLSEADAQKKLEKWNLKIIEAMKQSGNIRSFEISAPKPFGKVLDECATKFEHKFLASLQPQAKPFLKVLNEEFVKPANACILIGPEGDLSLKEYALASQLGFRHVSLGDSVLKCDTASASILSIISAHIFAKF